MDGWRGVDVEGDDSWIDLEDGFNVTPTLEDLLIKKDVALRVELAKKPK